MVFDWLDGIFDGEWLARLFGAASHMHVPNVDAAVHGLGGAAGAFAAAGRSIFTTEALVDLIWISTDIDALLHTHNWHRKRQADAELHKYFTDVGMDMPGGVELSARERLMHIIARHEPENLQDIFKAKLTFHSFAAMVGDRDNEKVRSFLNVDAALPGKEELTAIYRDLMKKIHPDLLKDKIQGQDAEALTKTLNHAFHVLKDEGSRERYHRLLEEVTKDAGAKEAFDAQFKHWFAKDIKGFADEAGIDMGKASRLLIEDKNATSRGPASGTGATKVASQVKQAGMAFGAVSGVALGAYFGMKAVDAARSKRTDTDTIVAPNYEKAGIYALLAATSLAGGAFALNGFTLKGGPLR